METSIWEAWQKDVCCNNTETAKAVHCFISPFSTLHKGGVAECGGFAICSNKGIDFLAFFNAGKDSITQHHFDVVWVGGKESDCLVGDDVGEWGVHRSYAFKCVSHLFGSLLQY